MARVKQYVGQHDDKVVVKMGMVFVLVGCIMVSSRISHPLVCKSLNALPNVYAISNFVDFHSGPAAHDRYENLGGCSAHYGAVLATEITFGWEDGLLRPAWILVQHHDVRANRPKIEL